MSVRVDFEGLLSAAAASEGGAVAFAIRSDGRGDPRNLIDMVRLAIGTANAAARERLPDDPTWATEPDLAGEEIRSELADGPRTESELRSWFADLAAALGDRELLVRPVTPDDRLPDFDPWVLDLEPAVTAFVNFSAPWEGRLRTTTAATIDAIADGLSSWCRLAGATTIARRGTSTFVIDHRDAARELRASPAIDYMYGLWQVCNAPRRARLVDFAFQAKAVLQVVGETSTAAERLRDLLAGLRVVAPYVDYAWVRRATPLIPNELDTPRLGRQPTAMEELAADRRVMPVLTEYVIDAYVAQVLTTQHLERAGSLVSFEIENLGGDRHLVVARDPEAWLNELLPAPGLLERARGELGAALLTAEVAYSLPGWPPRTARSEESA